MIRKNDLNLGKKYIGEEPHREEQQYEFDFCKQCEFYDCELVGEYMQFRDNHFQISYPKIKGRSDTEIKTWVVLHGNFDINSPSYDRNELSNGCIMNRQDIVQIECGNKNVTDGIGNHYRIGISADHSVENYINYSWEPSQPVFISAQTGSGKNYFIENTLIPYVKNLNHINLTKQKILILSNRLALNCQIEERIKEDDVFYYYRENTYVMTYQSLLGKKDYFEYIQAQEDSRYVYVICDEAHFFTSDAMFNPHTEKILSEIVRLFKKAIRIYMSATPYECLKYIIESEKKLDSYCQMAFYHFKRDYSYLDIKNYSKIEEDLYDEIVTSVNRGKNKQKWLIFIDNIEKCKNVKKGLEEYGDKATKPMIDEKSKISKIHVVDATSKKDEEYRSIIDNEKLGKDTYVLISTSVLDNGINLNGINNIVISDMSKVKCLQMAGRARVRNKDGAFEQKTLYIQRFNENYVNRRLNDFKKLKEIYYDYELAYRDKMNDSQKDKYRFFSKYYDGDIKDWNNAKHLFGRSQDIPSELYLNIIAKSLLNKFIHQYDSIYNEMKEEHETENSETANREGKYAVGQKYLEHQLSWFGKKFSAENDIPLVRKKEFKKKLMDFIKQYADKYTPIDKEKQEDFREKFTELYDGAFQREDKNKPRKYDIGKINVLLDKQNIGYVVNTVGECWVVEKTEVKETVVEKRGKKIKISKSVLNQINSKKNPTKP